MTTLPYCRLVNSNGSLDKRLVVPRDEFHPAPDRAVSANRTESGALNACFGAVKQRWVIGAKVREVEIRPQYASLADLETFRGYDNPQGTPSNVLTFYDPLNTAYSVVMVGDLEIEPTSVKLAGAGAVYIARFSLQEL